MAAPSPRAPTAWLLIPLILGYIAASAAPTMPGLLAFAGTWFCTLAAIAAWSRIRWVAAAWPLLMLVSGMLLAGSYLQLRLKPPPEWDSLPTREAILTVAVGPLFPSSIPGERIHGLARIQEAEPHLADLVGRKIYFSMRPSPENTLWARGTILRTVGVLEAFAPDALQEDFTRHLIRSGAQFEYRLVDLREEAKSGAGFFAFCARQSERFERYLRRGAIDRASTVDIYVAMLLGKRAELNEKQETAFLQTGTLHLFAISGLHIGVIAFALHNLLTLLRVPEKPAAAIGLILLFCFVGITGAAPSAIRAFLMVFCFWGARFLVRGPNPVAALANSALLVLLIYPGQLWSPGFQLSYSVVAGILFLGLPLGRHLQEKWMPFPNLPPHSATRPQRLAQNFVWFIAGTLAISLSATLLSSPLSIHYFEIFSPGGIPLNLILIPVASGVIVAGFISVFLNLLGLGLVSIIFNHAAWMILIAMEAVVTAAPSLPLFWKANFHAPWAGPVCLFVILTSLLLCAQRQWKAPFFHFATPFLLFVIFLTTTAQLTFLGD